MLCVICSSIYNIHMKVVLQVIVRQAEYRL